MGALTEASWTAGEATGRERGEPPTRSGAARGREVEAGDPQRGAERGEPASGGSGEGER